MRTVIQRVKNAKVEVDGSITGAIKAGLLVYLGVGRDDTKEDADWLANKISGLRIFEDSEEKMNLSVADIHGGVLVISQFTLFADARKGKRPSYGAAADPEKAEALYEYFISVVRQYIPDTASGVFAAKMEVSYINMGPVTILLDTKKQP